MSNSSKSPQTPAKIRAFAPNATDRPVPTTKPDRPVPTIKPDQRFMRGGMKDVMKTLLPGFPLEEEEEEWGVRVEDVEEYVKIDAKEVKAAKAEEARKKQEERAWTIIGFDRHGDVYYDTDLERTEGEHAKAVTNTNPVAGESKVEQEIAPDIDEIIAETRTELERSRSVKRVMSEEAEERMEKRRMLERSRSARPQRRSER